MSLKIGDKVVTKNIHQMISLLSGNVFRNGIKGEIVDFVMDDGKKTAIIKWDAGQKNLPDHNEFGTEKGQFPLEFLKVYEPMSLEPEQGFYVGQTIKLRNVTGSYWAEGNNVTDGTIAEIKGFYTCDQCDDRHIALEVNGREVLGITFPHIEAVETLSS